MAPSQRGDTAGSDIDLMVTSPMRFDILRCSRPFRGPRELTRTVGPTVITVADGAQAGAPRLVRLPGSRTTEAVRDRVDDDLS